MRRPYLSVVGIILLFVFPALSIPTSSQDDASILWNPAYKDWPHRQEIQLPIPTNNQIAHYQPIDLRIRFEKSCWTENENSTSIRISCWYNDQWHNLDSQIYSILKENGQVNYITECNIIFLIPDFADGTERYFVYYNDDKTSKPNYIDHVVLEDANYTSSPLPELSAQARFYGIKQDGFCIYGVGQEGTLLDRSCAQVVVKQNKGTKEFDIINSDQIVSFAFSYYYGSKEKDESASDQVFLDKKVFIDGNLMVEFGIISESKKKDIQTTAIYRYYYCPLEAKRIYVHVKHEMLKDATVQGIDNIDGRFGSLISIKARSAVIESLNFGKIHPLLNFYSQNERIEQYQLNQNPSTREREWLISYKNDASLGTEAWLSYGEGKKGKSKAVIFSSNEDIVISGTDEQDGVQIKVAEKEYLNFLGTEVDYVSINFGRRSYKPGGSHDVLIPSDLTVQFDADVFSTDTGGYEAVQKESMFYKALIKSRKLSGDNQFEREQKRYNITIIPRFGGTRLTHPWLSNLTGIPFPVMWIELHREGRLIAEGSADRFLFARARKTFFQVLEGEYLVKVFFKTERRKVFTGSTTIILNKDTKVTVFCTWERTIKFTFLDGNGNGITGIYAWLTNQDGMIFDENSTNDEGVFIVRAPYSVKEPYLLRAKYKGIIIYESALQKSLKKLNVEVIINLYTFDVIITDRLDRPPGIDIIPLLIKSNGNKTQQLIPKDKGNGLFTFEEIPAGDYHLQLSYGEFIDTIHITIPGESNVIRMSFSAAFDLSIQLYDSKGNTLINNNIELVVIRDNKTIGTTKEKTITLPPAQYRINAYLDNKLIGVKQVELISDKQLMLVTTVDSLFPLILSLLLYILFAFFVILTILKKFSLSSLLKSLAILFVIFSLFQPWWLFTGISSTLPIEKTTSLYINPGMMIETKKYYGELTLTLAEMPEIFIMFLAAMVPLASFACISISLGIILKRTPKKKYAFLLSVCGVILLSILLSMFYAGTTKLIESSIGTVQGEGMLMISIDSEEVLMNSNWGFTSGFYFACLAILVAMIAIGLDVRLRFKQKKKL